MNRRAPSRIGPRLTFGLLLILAGLGLALQNLDMLHFQFWELFVPAAVVVLGVSNLVQHGPLRLGGHVMIFFGGAFLLGNLGYGWIPERFWPLGLVWAGIVLVLRALVKPAPVNSEPLACEDAERGSHD